MRNPVMSLLLLGIVFSFSEQVRARPGYDAYVPNADQFNCGLCHVNAGGGGLRNAFGSTVESHFSRGIPNWPTICSLDSDGDGQSNGQELGDPFCQWHVTQVAPRTTALSHPANKNSRSTNPTGVDEAADDGGTVTDDAGPGSDDAGVRDAGGGSGSPRDGGRTEGNRRVDASSNDGEEGDDEGSQADGSTRFGCACWQRPTTSGGMAALTLCGLGLIFGSRQGRGGSRTKVNFPKRSI